MLSISALLALVLPSAHACTVSALSPLNGTTLTTKTNFTFQMTTDCTTSTFSVAGTAGTKTPVQTGMVGGKKQMQVTTTDADWTSWTRSTKATIVWTATAADAAAASNTKSATNQLDLDADSWTRTAGDAGTCDAAATVNPGVAETCDSIDNNCNVAIDEGVTLTFHVDADSDGHGAITGATTAACSAPSGYVASADDCDDLQGSTYPGASESCNSRDDDCDGTVDEAGAVGSTLYFADTDTDGYGDVAYSAFVCTQPSGYVLDSTDCNDGAAAVNPAALEVCNDIDDDCNTLVDLDDPELTDASWVYTDIDTDGYGAGAAYAICGVATAGQATVAGDCNDSAVAAYPGAPERCDNLDNDCDGLTDEAGALDGVSYYVDADTDGYGDPTTGVSSCTSPGAGWVTLGTDCDDTNDTRSPGIAEYCDGTDNDCNDLVTDDGRVSIGAANYTTINDAVAAADIGATVNVCAGTWRESISVTDDIVLNAPQGPDVTILDGGGRRQILRASGTMYEPSGSVEVYGFTFRRGYANCSGCTGNGGAIEASGASLLVVENSRFERNVAAGLGGAIEMPQTANAWVEVVDSQFSRNRAGSGGALSGSAWEGGAGRTLHIAASTFSDNYASSEGGALYDYTGYEESGGLEVLVDSSTFSGNRASNGGAFRLRYASLAVVDSTLTDNFANSAGGVVHAGSTPIAFTRSTLADNYAGAYGGVASCNEVPCDATLEESAFSYNNAGSYGGVLYTGTTGTLTLTSNTFTGNTSGNYGGVLALSPTTLVSSGNTFQENGAGSGGGLYYFNYDIPLAWSSTLDAFADNYAWSGSGGAISANYLAATFNDSTFEGNEATGTGGALYVYGTWMGVSNAAFTGAAFINNHATGEGGAVHLQDPWGVGNTASFDGVYGGGNSAGSAGGFLRQSGGSVSLVATEILDSSADSGGGGVNVTSGTLTADAATLIQRADTAWGLGGCLSASSSTISGVVCDEGSAPNGYGGGIYASNSTLSGVTVTDSTALYGGGMRLDFSTLTGASASGNTATYEGGGVSGYGTTISDLQVDGNHAGTSGGGLWAYGYDTFSLVDVNAVGNSAGLNGGGAYVQSMSWSGGSVLTNTAASGGGVYASSSALSNLTATYNTATSGGGLYASSGTASLLVVSDNDAADGGGVYATSLTATDVTVSGNAASTSGGGVYLSGGTWTGGTISGNTAPNGGGVRQASGTITGATISGNTATGFGGAVYGYGSILTSVVQSNEAAVGAGGYCVDSDSIWQDTNVYNNVASGRGGGAYVTTGRTLYTTLVDFGSGATDNSPQDVYLQFKNQACTYSGAGTRNLAGSAVRCPS